MPSFTFSANNDPADNQLKPESGSQWMTSSPGEKSITCTLKLEEEVKISQIDIGNAGSAFIEVLVGKSTYTDVDYKVILVASSFMNPRESREGQNRSRVRHFSKDALSQAVVNEKWERVKVVCSQPFNKTDTYGMLFIKIQSLAEGEAEPSTSGESTLGAFKLRTEEHLSSLKTGSLFANRHKENTASPARPLTGAAAVRAASKDAEEELATHSTPSSKGTRKERDTASASSPPPKIAAKRKPTTEDENGRPPLKRQSLSTSSVASESSARDSVPPVKKSRSEPMQESPSKPFGRLMKKVVFVLSGFQNPERSDIRDRALEMGATYRPDWGNGCTHLVCAFANTPKYNAVRKKGRIVTKDWINNCHRKGRLLPWRRYRLGNAPSPDASSASEPEEEAPPRRNPPKRQETPKPKVTVERERAKSPVASTSRAVDSDDPAFYEGSTDEEVDTDDEIQRIRAAGANSNSTAASSKVPKKPASPTVIEVEESTDDEDMMENLPELPNFFTGKHFMLYGNFKPSDRRLLTRFIIAYNGKLEEYMNDNVRYVLSNDDWDDNFDDALSQNPELSFVRPAWVLACNDKQKFLPHQKFVIVPA